MNKKPIVFALLFLITVLFLSSCQAAVTPAVVEATATQDVQPTNTDTPEPTFTTIPLTATATLELSPTPEGQIFRDDFSGPLSSSLTWKNEQKDKWTLTDNGFLQIIGQNDVLITNGTQNNLLCAPLPEGDFAASTHVITSPNANFQQAAIFIYENGDNFVTINRGYCDLSGCKTGGNAFYMDYKVNGVWGTYNFPAQETDVYLKLERVGTVLSGYYATKPGEWNRLGRFGDLFELNEVCLGASNGADVNSDIVAQFDYLDISAK